MQLGEGLDNLQLGEGVGLHVGSLQLGVGVGKGLCSLRALTNSDKSFNTHTHTHTHRPTAICRGVCSFRR